MAAMRLLNFSVGRVQIVEIGGEAVRTAHVKAPVAEPWTITADGASGDERAVHPDKLYAFARTGYAYWAEHLGVDEADWPDGFFGENLTLDSLDEEDLRVGDVLALGDEVRLVVVGARNPCIKLSWRLGQPRTFQKLFAKSRHSGVYFGVQMSGVVRPGDTLQRIRHDPAMPSIADVCDFVADAKAPPLAPLERLLAFDGLSLTNRLLLGFKRDLAERASALDEGRWRGWRRFHIDSVVDEAPGIRSVQLRPSDGGRICQPRPGQFVTVRMTGADGVPVTRSWSLSAFAHDLTEYRISVRRQQGAGSAWLHAAEIGASVELRAPAGEFVLDMGGYRPVVLVAAGIGITPLLAMLHAHLGRPLAASVHLIYGARRPEELGFRRELDALAAAHGDLKISYVFSQSAGERPAGRITPDLLVGMLGDLYVTLDDGHRVDLPWFESDIYLCGPGDFCRDIRDQLIARGGNGDHIRFEHFTALPAEATGLAAAEIRFRRSGLSAQWSADEDLSLLELAERAGIAVDSDCRAGACLTCKTSVVDGETTAVLDDNVVLLCMARPKTDTVELDL